MKAVLTIVGASVIMLLNVDAATAQSIPEPYTEPVLGMLMDVPVFPTSTAQINAQLIRVTPSGHIEVHASLTELRRRLQERADRTEAAATIAVSAPAMGSNQAQQEMMRRMQDPAFQQRLAAMSEEEQMAFALQMQQTMEGGSSGGGMTPVDLAPTVDQLSRNIHELLLTGVYGPANVESIGVHVSRALEQIEAERAEIMDWEAAEFEGLPNDTEKGGDKEPRAAKALRLASINKQIAVADAHLQDLSVHWSRELSRSRPLIESSDGLLMDIGYFDRVSDGPTRGTLMGNQAEMLKYVDRLCAALESIALTLGPLHQERQSIEGS